MSKKQSVGRIGVMSVMAAFMIVLGSASQALADKDPCTEKCDSPSMVVNR